MKKKVKTYWGEVFVFKPGQKAFYENSEGERELVTIKTWKVYSPERKHWGCTVICEDGDEFCPPKPTSLFPASKLHTVLE